MAKYIDRDSLIEWLKRIRLVDLSDGLGICRVIMEDDFKKAITNMPENIIVDVAPVVRCKDCKHYKYRMCELIGNIMDGYYHGTFDVKRPDDFCSYGVKKGGDEVYAAD